VVSPATQLRPNRTVHVTVSGFPDGKVFLSQCASDADATPFGCGGQLARQPFILTSDGRGTGTFTVSARAAATPDSAGDAKQCATACVIVATDGEVAGEGSTVATASIAFSQ
jgi:hypothetical protein